MISVGKNIQSSSDKLQKVDIEYIIDRIRSPKTEIKNRLKHLRIVHDIDAKEYNRLKRELPYFTCGIFQPPFRRTENFAYSEFFIVDIDHIHDNGYDIYNIKDKICHDRRVMVAFLSPSMNGLKVIFKLRERCYDAELYRIFYKRFIDQWGTELGIGLLIDKRTSDVTRACFISHDENAFFNSNAESIDINEWIAHDNPSELFESLKDIRKEYAEENDAESKYVDSTDPDDETIDKIKETLSLKRQKVVRKKTDVYVPDEVSRIITHLKEYVTEYGIEMYESMDIQYGMKLRFRLGAKKAEINLFFGKRGYTVVKCPRNGTSVELNDICGELTQLFLNELS